MILWGYTLLAVGAFFFFIMANLRNYWTFINHLRTIINSQSIIWYYSISIIHATKNVKKDNFDFQRCQTGIIRFHKDLLKNILMSNVFLCMFWTSSLANLFSCSFSHCSRLWKLEGPLSHYNNLLKLLRNVDGIRNCISTQSSLPFPPSEIQWKYIFWFSQGYILSELL